MTDILIHALNIKNMRISTYTKKNNKFNKLKINRLFRSFFFFVLVVFLILSCKKTDLTVQYLTVQVEVNSTASQVKYGVKQLKQLEKTKAIKFSDSNPDIIIHAKVDSVNLQKEAYKITAASDQIELTGGDNRGLMYGLLELKEQLKSGRSIQSKYETPYLSFRAIKYNLPWDSYRNSEALRLHYETCRDTNYWESFLDMMAENRFNKLTLWNLHPFNYLVKTEKYPEACGFTDMELEDWQQFWHSLFRMAKNRGIDTYLINWNIFVSPEFAKARNVAEYCLTHEYYVDIGDTSEIIKDYTRECVKEVIDTYPNLTGLGITLGEGMGGMKAEEREQWLLDSFIEGMRMASRKIKFIHRVPLSAGTSSVGSTSIAVENMTRQTLDSLTGVDGPINIELKFNWSHAFSTPHLVKVHGGKLTDAYWNPMPKNYYLAWMMRNEDFFMLRWGQPDFIRQHIALNVHPYVNGYFVGSECYIPAKDYITALDGASYNYAFQRQWMFYKVCGRLFYNPETPDVVFKEAFESRFSGQGEKLFDAQTKVSQVPLIIASYQNATWDFTLYSEGMLRVQHNDGKRSVRLIPLTEMANNQLMEPAYLSISEFLDNESNIPPNKISPLQMADSIDSFCRSAIQEVESIKTDRNVDLLYEVSDIKTWANLGMYFSNKLRAALEYKRYTNSYDKADLDKGIMWLEKAVKYWHAVVEITQPIYDPVPLVHLSENEKEYFHWSMIEKQVNDELDWLKSVKSNQY